MTGCGSMTNQTYAAATFGERMNNISSSPRRSDRKRKSAKEESNLVTRLQAGDELALEELFNLYSTRLYNVAHRILGEVADTEEVIQDVF